MYNTHSDYYLVLLETAFRKPLSTLVMADIDVIQKTLQNHLLMRVKAELDQFLEGLAVCGVGEDFQRYCH